ncbi:MAG: endonuclease/exonuclease/phosphatase family protein [Clostridia bacterium]|nr:endonuclease/exonuclease/phosphatase family protein [Clostridia bacterium]
MFFSTIQKWIALFLSLTMIFSVSAGVRWADSMTDGFPVIAPAEKAPEDVRVMSFNIRCTDNNGVPAILRHAIVAKQILKIKPDSFGVQEATAEWMAALKTLLPAYACVGVARDNGKSIGGVGEYNAVFYLREKYDLLDHCDFWLSDTPETPSIVPGADCRRICTWAKLQNKETAAIYVHVNAHLDSGSANARELGAKLITDFIGSKFPASTPVVFTADMNAGESSVPYRIMTGSLADARYAAKDSEGTFTFHKCFTEDAHPRILDYVMCKDTITVNAFRVVTSGIDGRFVSDHFPIYADVFIPGARGSGS